MGPELRGAVRHRGVLGRGFLAPRGARPVDTLSCQGRHDWRGRGARRGPRRRRRLCEHARRSPARRDAWCAGRSTRGCRGRTLRHALSSSTRACAGARTSSRPLLSCVSRRSTVRLDDVIPHAGRDCRWRRETALFSLAIGGERGVDKLFEILAEELAGSHATLTGARRSMTA